MGLDNPNKYINRIKVQFPGLHQQLVTQGVSPRNIAFFLINEDSRVNGTYWNKCFMCDQPYVVVEVTNDNDTFCSPECEQDDLTYRSIVIQGGQSGPISTLSKGLVA